MTPVVSRRFGRTGIRAICAAFGMVVTALTATLAATGANAHEIRPAVITADLATPGRFSITVSANLEALIAGIGAEHKDTDDAPGSADYKQLRSLSADDLRRRFDAFSGRWLADLGIGFDGVKVVTTVDAVTVPVNIDPALARISVVTLSGVTPANAKAFQWSYPRAYGTSVLRVKRAGVAELETSWLKDGAVNADVPLQAGAPKSVWRQIMSYVVLGFTHILPQGIDHILFVLGLFFLSQQLRPLLIQVTAFTVAHSITLALGLYGIFSLSPKIVEPLIALSIVFVAVENIFTAKLSPWRPFVVFGFGLLHGMGFAGILQEIGLPRSEYLTSLIGFNIGVELGQLTVIALAWMATTYWFGDRPWFRRRIVWPVSAAIALMGVFWTIERIWFV